MIDRNRLRGALFAVFPKGQHIRLSRILIKLETIVGALLALPIAATILMLIDELRVELPGQDLPEESRELKKKDEQSEAEYVQRTEGMPAKEAAVAIEISDSLRKQENAAEPKTNDRPKE